MLRLNLDQRPPSIQERVDIMRKHISKGGVPVDYDRLVEYLTHFRVEMFETGSKLLSLMKSKDPYFTSNSIKKWTKENNIKVGFNLTETGNVSYNAESLDSFINTNYYGEEITNIVKILKLYNFYTAQISLLPGILDQYQPSGLESEDGRRLVLIKPGIEAQNTGRFGIVNPALMNLPRIMKDIYVAPKGWTLMSADSGQIEPKFIYGFYMPDRQIQKLILLYGDAYYAILHYCRMPIEDIRNMRMDFEAIEITPELKELRQKLKTYGNGVMYGSTYNPEKDKLKEQYIQRIGQHPLRIEWQKKLEIKLNQGQRIFPSLFGTPVDIYKSEKFIKAKTDKDKQLALIHCMINNPIQATAGDCMGFSLQASDYLLSKKAPNSWITKYVHDEGQYCIHNSEKDYVLEELSGHTSYNVEDIVLIYNEPKFGREFNKDIPISYEHLFSEAV
jgi:hypothetical protein